MVSFIDVDFVMDGVAIYDQDGVVIDVACVMDSLS